MKQLPFTLDVDIVIFGGGIAGLWALNVLRAQGYQAILLETDALGAGQTSKSQGIIHGGIKYALGGFLSSSANAVSEMPKRWKDCLAGAGEIDLRSVKTLSSQQLLWSTGSLTSEVASFFATKALNSRVKRLNTTEYPSVLRNPAFKGHVFSLDEVVLDTISLVQSLANTYPDYMIKIDPQNGSTFQFDLKDPKKITSLEIHSNQKRLVLKAKRYLLTAGEGNEKLSISFAEAPKMQRRPLQMVVVKLKTAEPFFAHCINASLNPRITITSHPTHDGKTVWYLGGQLAEDGANRTQVDQIKAAKMELATLFPWLDLTEAEWQSFYINRAELKQPGGKRPETACLDEQGNTFIAWPTKLALTPLLCDQLLATLKKQGFSPTEPKLDILPTLSEFTKPSIAKPIWDQLFA